MTFLPPESQVFWRGVWQSRGATATERTCDAVWCAVCHGHADPFWGTTLQIASPELPAAAQPSWRRGVWQTRVTT